MALFSNQIPYWSTTGIISSGSIHTLLDSILTTSYFPPGPTTVPSGIYYIAMNTTTAINNVLNSAGTWVIVQGETATYEQSTNKVISGSSPLTGVGIYVSPQAANLVNGTTPSPGCTLYAYVYRFV